MRLQNIHPNIPAEILAGLVSRHGTRAENLLANISLVSEMPANTGTDTATDIPSPLGRDFGGGLTEYEARYFIAHEWAQTADDILWRRTKAGLFMSVAQRQAFADWLGRGMVDDAGQKSGQENGQEAIQEAAQDKTLETETNP